MLILNILKKILFTIFDHIIGFMLTEIRFSFYLEKKDLQWVRLTVSWIFGLNIANLSKNMLNHSMRINLCAKISQEIHLWL